MTAHAVAVQSTTTDAALLAASSEVTNSAGDQQEPRSWRLTVTVAEDNGQQCQCGHAQSWRRVVDFIVRATITSIATARTTIVLSSLSCALASFVATAPGTAHADDDLHLVTYTVSTDSKTEAADIYYRATEPPEFADYSHDPYLHTPLARQAIGPTTPWVREVTMAAPDQWAIIAATDDSDYRAGNLRCTIAVDGQVVVSRERREGILCSIRSW